MSADRVALRFLLISFINVFNHQLFLFIGQSVFDVKPWLANIFAACLAAIPAYFMSRYWVWQVTGKSSLKFEILPFWAVSLLGLIISTLSVRFAESLMQSWILFQAASFAGYLIAWVIKFILLGRVFKQNSKPEYEIIDCWNVDGPAES